MNDTAYISNREDKKKNKPTPETLLIYQTSYIRQN